MSSPRAANVSNCTCSKTIAIEESMVCDCCLADCTCGARRLRKTAAPFVLTLYRILDSRDTRNTIEWLPVRVSVVMNAADD